MNEFLAKQSGKRDARDLEAGVAWLLWLLGFSVAHLGGNSKSQEGPDLIATTPQGHFCVIECTTGLLKADNKLPRLIERTTRCTQRLSDSNTTHLRTIAVIVTSRPKEEVKADIEQAERLGVLVITKEDLENAIDQSTFPQNADILFDRAENKILSNKNKYSSNKSI